MPVSRLAARVILFLVFTVKLASAQFNNFKTWGINEGLIQSDIFDVLQDRRGFIWIASGGGVSVFDGIRFKHFTKTQGLNGNVVRCLHEDASGRIWMGANEGLCFYNGIEIKKFSHPNYKGSTALCFDEDKEGRLYVGTDDGGLNVISTKDSLWVKNIDEKKGLGSNSVMGLATDKAGNIWMATYGGGLNILKRSDNGTDQIEKALCLLPSELLISIAIKDDNVWVGSYDAGAFRLSAKMETAKKPQIPQVFNTKSGLSSNYIWTIMLPSSGEVWLGTVENGINRIRRSAAGHLIQNLGVKQGVSDNQILCLFEDQDHNVWIGTNGAGLNMFRGDHFSNFGTQDGLRGGKVQALIQDTTGDIWFAASGAGLSRLSFSSGLPQFTPVFAEIEEARFISSIAAGNQLNKNIWLGTDKNGIIKYDGKKFEWFSEKDGLLNNSIYSMFVDSKGIVWAGTADGISRFDGRKFLSISTDQMKMQNEGVNSIVQDAKGNMWFGTSGGLARYSGEGDLRTFDEVEGLANKDVICLAPRKNGDVYIGTASGGIYRYNHLKNDSQAIEFVTNEQKILSNSIRSLIFLNEKVLIAGTYKGFDKIILSGDGKVESVAHYTGDDGFAGLECNDNAILLDKEGAVWFGTVNGISRYNPAAERSNKEKPVVYISDVQLFYQDVDWQSRGGQKEWFNIPKQLELSHNENILTFKFHSSNFANPAKVFYKFKLSGRDEEWSPPMTQSEERITGLGPGNYTFMVVAGDGVDTWSEPATLAFTVNPPWYRTTLFYIIVILLLIVAAVLYVRWRERKLVKEKEILENTVRERTHEVEVQKEHLAEKNKEITDSINYAKGIQNSMLPPLDEIQSACKDLFVFFQPKDIVSGDFYWFSRINEHEFLIACADCTGHGVPGGFMSMICSEKLHDGSRESQEPAKILKSTNNGVKTALRQQTYIEGKSKDGMEICLVKVNTVTRKISYSGANRLLWIIDGETKELKELKPTKASIASFTPFDFEYEQTDLQLKKGDLIYTTSDGYPDQFGGADGKKYMSKNMKQFILSICHESMETQKALLSKDINQWMSNCEQVDDLLVIGMRL